MTIFSNAIREGYPHLELNPTISVSFHQRQWYRPRKTAMVQSFLGVKLNNHESSSADGLYKWKYKFVGPKIDSAFGMYFKVGVRVPLRSRHLLFQKLRNVYKKIYSWIENEYCCLRTVNISNVNLTLYIHILHYKLRLIHPRLIWLRISWE